MRSEEGDRSRDIARDRTAIVVDHDRQPRPRGRAILPQQHDVELSVIDLPDSVRLRRLATVNQIEVSLYALLPWCARVGRLRAACGRSDGPSDNLESALRRKKRRGSPAGKSTRPEALEPPLCRTEGSPARPQQSGACARLRGVARVNESAQALVPVLPQAVSRGHSRLKQAPDNARELTPNNGSSAHLVKLVHVAGITTLEPVFRRSGVLAA